MPFNPMYVAGGQVTWKSRSDDYTTTITSAAAITLPGTGYRLVRVMVQAGSTPGTFSLLYDGIHTAHFPCTSNATNGEASWAVTFPVKGITIPAGIQTFNDGVNSVTLTFSRGASQGPTIEAYKAVIIYQSVSNEATQQAFTTASTSFPGEATPTGCIAVCTIVGTVYYWPAVGAAQASVSANFSAGNYAVHPAPALPAATSITPTWTSGGNGKLLVVVGYND